MQIRHKGGLFNWFSFFFSGLTRRMLMVKHKYLLYLLSAVLLLSFSVEGLAQGVTPPPDDPGISPDGEMGSGISIEAGVENVSWAFTGGPSYDSGWVAILPDTAQTLVHNLGGDVDDYVVDMQYRNDGISGVNQRYYGGADFGASPPAGMNADDRVGAYWRSLTDTSITIYRRPEDIYAEDVRIRIWTDPVPTYDSGWITLTPGAAATTLNHGLGGDADDYVVDMQYRSGGDGVNQRYYGGVDFGAKAFNGSREDDRIGLYWRSLTNTEITLFRRTEDDYAPEVRVRIWARPTPTFDSGWIAINQDTAGTLVHDIGGNPDDYVVDMQYRSGGDGVNQRYYGGADLGANTPYPDYRMGAYWRSLTDTSISIYRRPEDIYAPQVRIRIWCFWTPPAPDYDSGWVDLGLDIATELSHGLGGNTDDYLVNMQYRNDGISGVNQRYYGGADFGASPPAGMNADDRVGVYWRSLTDTSITVYRRPEDIYASQVRIRIWVMPKPDYDSGWFDLTAGAAATELTHNLQGDYWDYMVDLQYRSAANGVNQRYYGGADFGANPPSGSSENDRVGVYWRSLDLFTITVYRCPEDIYGEQARVRIWRTALPGYESGWQVVALDSSETWTHNLGGNADNYLVDMLYYDEDLNYINQRHLGGADFGSMPPSGYSENDRVGAYWRSLNPADITVYRRPEDGLADYLRVRIWDYNKNLYLPVILNE
jgi:hypothetical protein